MIILQILRIIGIILLILIGLLLLLILLVLFVPVRYEGSGEYYGKLKGSGKVSWLLFALRFFYSQGEESEYTLSLAGLTLYPRKKKAGKSKIGEAETRKAADTGASEREQSARVREVTETVDEPTKEIPAPRNHPDTTKAPEKKREKKKSAQEMPSEKRSEKRSEKHSKGKSTKTKRSQEKPSSGKTEQSESKLASLREKKEKWTTPEMKTALAKLYRIGLKLLKHIFPKCAEGFLRYGLPDPALSGQAAGLLGSLYAGSEGRFLAEPDFLAEKAFAEGHGRIKGRVVLGYIGFLAILVIADRNIRTQYRQFR